MKVSHSRSLCSLLLASVLAGCGGGPEGSSDGEAEGLETNTAAVISGASRGATVQVSATDGVNLRSGAGTSYAILTTAPYQKTATVLDATPSNGFYKVNYQGTVGWAHGDYWNVVSGLKVNGYTLTSTQDTWVRWIAKYSVPKLRGERGERLTVAARVAWWSLKEGVLDLSNPFPYSNCHTSGGDVPYGPLGVCAAGQAWQVGISGIQVTGATLATVQSTSASLHPSLTEPQVLGASANQAGYATGTSIYNSIVNSTGDLRKSWLMRNHAVGITLQEPVITRECITGGLAWCYSTAWPTSAQYAPNRTEALESIQELKAILDGLAP